MRPIDDPGVRVFRAIETDYERYKRQGGTLSFDEWVEENESIRKREEADRREKDEKERVAAQQRREDIERRKRNRNQQPEQYVPPASVEALREAMKSDQFFLEGCLLKGSAEQPLVIDFDLASVNLARSVFEHVRFVKGADLNEADLTSTKFRHVTVEREANFESANFRGAEINQLRVSGEARIAGASFQFAEFKNRSTIAFDQNNLQGAVFFKGRADEWNTLASQYSLLWQMIYLGLFGLYVGPVIAKVYLFKLLQTSQDWLIASTGEGETVTITIWQVVFGGSWVSGLGVLLFTSFHGVRTLVTTRISPMIESERQSGYTPQRSVYGELLKWHGLQKTLGILVIVVVIWDFSSIFRERSVEIPSIQTLQRGTLDPEGENPTEDGPKECPVVLAVG